MCQAHAYNQHTHITSQLTTSQLTTSQLTTSQQASSKPAHNQPAHSQPAHSQPTHNQPAHSQVVIWKQDTRIGSWNVFKHIRVWKFRSSRNRNSGSETTNPSNRTEHRPNRTTSDRFRVRIIRSSRTRVLACKKRPSGLWIWKSKPHSHHIASDLPNLHLHLPRV